MVVFSNRRLGAGAELVVSRDLAQAMLSATTSMARTSAAGRWELELVDWLAEQAANPCTIDVADIAWTPDHFDVQRRFLIDAIFRASAGTGHEIAYRRWIELIETHPRESVRFGRRWAWQRSVNA
jgi:hypothetical protein